MKEYDELEIKKEVEFMNSARSNGIPVPLVLEVTDKGLIMEKAKGILAYDAWVKFTIKEKCNFILSLTKYIRRLPKDNNLYLTHLDLDLENIFVDENGEITSIIDLKNAEYLPEIYNRKLPPFLCEGNYLNNETDTEILSNIFYKEMGKLSELNNLIIELHNVDDEYVKNISEMINNLLILCHLLEVIIIALSVENRINQANIIVKKSSYYL